MTPLPDIIADLRARLDALPPPDGRDIDTLTRQYAARLDALDALADQLAEIRGAQVGNDEPARAFAVTMQAIRADSRMGLEGALRNWIAAAERHLKGRTP